MHWGLETQQEVHSEMISWRRSGEPWESQTGAGLAQYGYFAVVGSRLGINRGLLCVCFPSSFLGTLGVVDTQRRLEPRENGLRWGGSFHPQSGPISNLIRLRKGVKPTVRLGNGAGNRLSSAGTLLLILELRKNGLYCGPVNETVSTSMPPGPDGP